MITASDLSLLVAAADPLAEAAARRLRLGEEPDGDLGSVDGLVAEAAAAGILADPGGDDGHWGVWGRHVAEDGVALSVAVLRRLGRVCAGLATAVHAQGLGAVLLGWEGEVHPPAGRRLAAAFCPPVGTALDPRTAGDGLHVTVGPGGRTRLDGTARFVLAAGAPDLLVAAARTAPPPADGWVVVALSPAAPGLALDPAGARMGLRATTMVDVRADGVALAPGDVRHRGGAALRALQATMACDWLGQAAIALGSAEQAVEDAAAYAATRVQGGAAIAHHGAVALLLGRAGHDLAVVDAVLARRAGTPLGGIPGGDLLGWGVDARLAAGEHAARAVTDALQVLGGYGYMDEYGLSKRFRDLSALRVLHGSPDQLLLLRRQVDRAEAGA